MSRPNTIVTVGVLLDQGEVLLGADHRARVAGERYDRKDAEHGVDGAPFEPEVAEVGSGEQGAVSLKQRGGRAPALDVRVPLSPA